MGFKFDLKRVSYDQTGIVSLMDIVAEVRASLNRMEDIVFQCRMFNVQCKAKLSVLKDKVQVKQDARLAALTGIERQGSWESQSALARTASLDESIETRKIEIIASFAEAALEIVQSKTRNLSAVRNDIQLMVDVFRLAALPREVS